MTAVTTLVVVPDEREERAVLDSLGALEAALDGPVAPVLGAGLAERTAGALRAAGIEVAVVTAGAARAALACLREPRAQRERAGRPGAVLVASGADPGLVQLAAALAGAAPRPLAAATLEPRAALDNPTAVILFGPEASVDEMTAGLAALDRAGVQPGLIPAGDPVADRFTVVKLLVPERLPRMARPAIMAGAIDPLAIRGGPACICPPDRPDSLARFQIERDVMVIGGHAFPFDQLIGAGLVLCARQGHRLAAAATARGQLPCFRDGQCFRQARLGRAPDAIAGLVDVAELRAAVAMFSGCHHAAFGRSWFDPRASVIYQAIQARPLAVVAGTSLSEVRLELDLLGLALLADGAALGEAVAEINRVRAVVHGRDGGLAPGVGPFALFGNPALRAATSGLPVRVPDIAGDGALTVTVGDLAVDPEYGAILRVPLPPGPRYLGAAIAPRGAWCRGIAGEHRGVASLYLWLGPGDGGRAETVAIERCAGDPWRCERTALAGVIAALPFWTVFLDSYRAEASSSQLPAEVHDRALAALPGALRQLASGVASLRLPAGLVEDREATFDTVVAPAWRRARAITEMLLACAIEVACRHGTMQFHGWAGAYAAGQRLGCVGRCVCGEADVWGQIHDGADGRLACRALYQCGRCGYVGEDDGRRLLTLVAVPRRARPGELIHAQCRVSAPADEVVEVHAAAVVERWRKDGRAVGAAVREVVDPASAAVLALSVCVPEQLTAGVVPFAVVAVVNGALAIVRQMIEVDPPPVMVRAPHPGTEVDR